MIGFASCARTCCEKGPEDASTPVFGFAGWGWLGGPLSLWVGGGALLLVVWPLLFCSFLVCCLLFAACVCSGVCVCVCVCMCVCVFVSFAGLL